MKFEISKIENVATQPITSELINELRSISKFGKDMNGLYKKLKISFYKDEEILSKTLFIDFDTLELSFNEVHGLFKSAKELEYKVFSFELGYLCTNGKKEYFFNPTSEDISGEVSKFCSKLSAFKKFNVGTSKANKEANKIIFAKNEVNFKEFLLSFMSDNLDELLNLNSVASTNLIDLA